MTDTLFDHAFRRDIARLADAMEGLLAYLVGATPTLAAKPPADFDGAQYAFDTMMGDPLAALGNLSRFAELTRNVPIGIALNDAQVGEKVRVKLTFRGPAADPAADPGDEDNRDDGKPARYTYTHWSKYDTRCRELARLRTAANHRAAAAKTPAVRDAATLEAQQHHNEAKARHSRLRRWLAEGRVAIIKGELVVYNGAKSFTWRSEYLQAPNYILTLPE